MAQAVQLNNVSGTLLPPTITGPIFQKARETSAVMSLARRVPLAVNAQTAIPISMDVPTAGWVNEGGVKPVGGAGMGVKIMTGKKVALLVPVSQEIAMTNAAGLYDQLVQDLPTAISRAFDFACINGKDLKSGGAGPFSDYLAATSNSQVIGATAASAGGVYADLVKGVQQVVNGPVQGYEFSGFAADPRLKPELMLSVDLNGRPLMLGQDTGALTASGGQLGSLIGYPAAYNTGVSGKYNRQGDSVLLATITGTPTGGTFTLTVGGATTAPIAYNATAAAVQTALQAAGVSSTPFGGNPATSGAAVTGSAGGPYTITLSQGAGPFSGNGKALTGGTNPSVSVTQAVNSDTGLRAIGGDWSQCAWGEGMGITIKSSDVASYVDGAGVTHSAFQENLIVLLVEAYYGFVVNDNNAFVAYTHAAGS